MWGGMRVEIKRQNKILENLNGNEVVGMGVNKNSKCDIFAHLNVCKSDLWELKCQCHTVK